MNYFIYTSHHFTPHRRYELNKLTSLPMCGFIALLVKHGTGIAEVTGSYPVEALIFSGFFFPIAQIGKFTAMIILHIQCFFMCDDGAGQFHHSKVTNRIGSTVISFSAIFLTGLLTFLWVMHRSVGYNNNIFLCHGGRVSW